MHRCHLIIIYAKTNRNPVAVISIFKSFYFVVPFTLCRISLMSLIERQNERMSPFNAGKHSRFNHIWDAIQLIEINVHDRDIEFVKLDKMIDALKFGEKTENRFSISKTPEKKKHLIIAMNVSQQRKYSAHIAYRVFNL